MIAVYGLGVSGLSVAKQAIKHELSEEVWLIDSSVERVEQLRSQYPNILLDKKAGDVFDEAKMIVLSPGIPTGHELLANYQDKLISEIEFAYLYSKVPVIAVTGSNGKTTTCMMISQLLEQLGKEVFLGGNIGTPYSEIIGEEYDYAVIEVSSFQLETTRTLAPVLAITTNITPTHMERYASFADYAAAKDKINTHIVREKQLRPSDIKPLFGYDSSNIVGEHNYQNLFCAYWVMEKLNLTDKRKFKQFVEKFNPAPFRLSRVSQNVFNDSKSTNLTSTLTAISALKNSEDLLVIIGGKKRSSDLSEFAALKGLARFVAFGEAANDLAQILGCQAFPKLEDIKDAELLYKTLLFSPGFPSFDQYTSYSQRGEHFNLLFQN